MKIIKRNEENGQIVEIYYVIVYGDIAGEDGMGDGNINSSDALMVLNNAANVETLSAVSVLAADVNHDGIVNSSDGLLILNYAANSAEIDQNVIIDSVPNECYYINEVTF